MVTCERCGSMWRDRDVVPMHVCRDESVQVLKRRIETAMEMLGSYNPPDELTRMEYSRLKQILSGKSHLCGEG